VCLFRREFLNLRSFTITRHGALDETSPMPIALRFDAALASRARLPTPRAINRIGTLLAAHAMLRLLRRYG
jgi:hypothetical protein